MQLCRPPCGASLGGSRAPSRRACLPRSASLAGAPCRKAGVAVQAGLQAPDKPPATEAGRAKTEAEEATEKYGLEAGLYKTMTGKEVEGGMSRTDQAKQLLTQYGSAYLITSISFAAVSFGLCYAAVSAGLDVAAVLAKIGLTVSDTNEKVGTIAIAYAAHKALSPVRFPPTVALTPVVARWLGKKAAGSPDASAGDKKE